MSSYRSRGRWVIWMSCFIALILQMMPWPYVVDMFRPSWLVLILIYWVMALPHRINVGTAFIFGLIWDLLLGSVLGLHSFALSIVVYLVAFKSQLLRNMALWQQSLVVLFLSALIIFVIFLLEFVLQHSPLKPTILWSSVTNAVLWPWLFLLMRKIRRKFGVQ